MDVMIEITKKVPLHSILATPSGRSEFELQHIDSEKVIIETKKGSSITIPASCFQNAFSFLRTTDWVEIGASHGVAAGHVFDSFLRERTSGVSVASYVAPILEKAGIVEINRKQPAMIRLRKQS